MVCIGVSPEGPEQKAAIANAFIEVIPPDMDRWVQIVDGAPKCLICNKGATPGHLVSSEHMRRIEEDAIGTLRGGKAKTTRRFSGKMMQNVRMRPD